MKNIELMLSHLFRMNGEVPNEIIAEMQKRIKSESANWKARIRKLENGGSCQSELARQRKYYKRKPWSERHIGKAKQAELAAGWAKYDAEKALSQGQ